MQQLFKAPVILGRKAPKTTLITSSTNGIWPKKEVIYSI